MAHPSAHCVDLPSPFGTSGPASTALATSADGAHLYVADVVTGKIADVDTATLAALIDRMQTLVDRLMGESGKNGSTGASSSLSKSGKIEVERQSLDELRAEIAQLKTMLNREKLLQRDDAIRPR